VTGHPNRSGKGRCRNPKPDEIQRMREKHSLTQDGAATLVCSKLRSWQQWEAGDRQMHPATWHLFLIRLGEEPPN
jgi:putative transcriptional regulator